MPSTFSPSLQLELIGAGEQAGIWNTTTNTNLGTLLDQAIAGYVTQAVTTGTNTTLIMTQGASAIARNIFIELTGTGGANTNLIVPASSKLYFIYNNTSSGQVTVKVSGQTGVSVVNSSRVILVCNGIDIINATSYVTSAGVGVTSVATGTGLTGGPITSTGTIALGNTGVTPGTYSAANITVDAQGRLTAAATGSAGGGTVTSVSVASANGFAGTVTSPTSAPVINLSTSITGILKGNSTSISAAVAGTDYYVPGGALGTPSGGTVTNLTGTASININGTVGATTAATGAFSTLSATGAVTFNTVANAQSYTTTGAGTITISSGTAGTINNMSIGATTATTGAFTTLSASGLGKFTGNATGGFNNRTVLVECTGGTEPGIGFHAPASSTAGIFLWDGTDLTFKFRNSINSAFVAIQAETITGANLFGQGQTLQDVSANRAANITYPNSTGRPIVVYVTVTNGAGNILAYINGVEAIVSTVYTLGGFASVTLFVLPGNTYLIEPQVSATIYFWKEIR